jgi:hypothetical protein
VAPKRFVPTTTATPSKPVFDEIPIAVLKSVGAPGLVTFAVLAVLVGALIPRWMHNERIKDKDRQINTLQAALDKRDEQVDKLLESYDVVIELLRSIKREAERRRE